MKKKLLLTLFLGLNIICINAQTGPGGVGNSTNNVFWLDANELNYLNNENVQIFSDISGNNNSFIQSVSSKQPIYKTNAVNGFPVVRFDGVNDELKSGSIPALESNSVTTFIVYKQNTQKNACFLGGNYNSLSYKWFVYGLGNGEVRSIQYSPNPYAVRYTDNYSTFNFLSSHITTNKLMIYKEGILKETKNANYNQPTGHNYCVISNYPGNTGNNWAVDGDIAEIITFNSTINDLERVIIENYLGAKYNKVIPEDYYAYETSHKYGVIGLGNDGVTSHTASTGYGVLTMDNPTALVSNEYMFVGHDGVDLSVVVNGDMPAAVSTHSRLSRTWRVDETGELGNVTLKFDVSGDAGFAQTSSYNLLVDTDGDANFTNSTVVSGTYNAGVFTVTLNLSAGSVFTLSGLPVIPSAIHSVQTGAWNTASTWDCGCVPTSVDTVYIEPTHTVSVDANAYVECLVVNSGGILEMTQDFLLSIDRDLTINGAVNLVNGELGFVGNNSQTISANGSIINLYKVLINNTSTSNITFTNGQYVLNNLLTPNNGNMVIDNAGSGAFIVNSTSATTLGRIGIMTPTCSITGNVTVRRNLPAGVAGERTISSPVIGANLSEWDADIAISGTGFPDGCAYGNNGCYYSCKRFIGGELTADYIDVTNPNEPLMSGIGYELFIGDDLNTFSGATLKSTGTLRDYQDFTLHYPDVKQGWNIVGNPYACPILFSQMSVAQMYAYFYVYDAQSGGYQWYDQTSNTSSIPELANGLIAIGQGFWIKAGGFPGVNYTQSIKTTTSNATFIRQSNTADQSIYLTLSQEGTTYKNVVAIDFNEVSLDYFDSLDVASFTLGKQKSASLFIMADEVKLSKNYLSNDGRDKTNQLSIKILTEGYYSIDVSNIENQHQYKYITLFDNLTHQKIDLRKYPHYSFYSEEGEFDRFTLILSNDRVVGNSLTTSSLADDRVVISQIGNAVNVQSKEVIEGESNLTIYNLLGQELIFSTTFEIQKGDNVIIVPENLSGIYIVVVESANGITTKKMMF